MLKHIRIPVWLYGFLPAACCLLKGLSDRLYTDIDSFLVSITCAGLYGEGSICPVIHPLLSLMTGFLSRLWPGADWFSVLGQAFIVLGIWWLGTLLALCISQPWKRLTCLLILCFALLQFSLFNINFTVYAGFFSFLGVATLLLSFRNILPSFARFFAVLFLCFGILWRKEGAALLLPFLLLDLCVLALSCKISRRMIHQLLFCCILPVAFLLLFSFVFSVASPARQTASVYSASRSILVDYPHLSWEEIGGTLADLGLSENDYNAVASGMLLDTERVTADFLQQVSAVSQTGAYPLSPANLFQTFSALPGVFSTPLLRILSLFSLALLLLLMVSGSPLYDKIEALLAPGGACVICLYYQYLGRLPERVAACVVLALLAVLLPLFLSAPSRQGNPARWFWRIACAAAGCVLCLCLWKNRYSYHILQPALLAGQTENQTTAAAFPGGENNDSVYLWNSTTLALYMTDHYLSQGKLPDENFVQHNLPWGEWNTSGQPYYEQLLAKLQMENPMQSLLTRPNTYLVGNDTGLIQTWLREHYDGQAVVQPIGTVDVFAMGEVPVWQASADPDKAES